MCIVRRRHTHEVHSKAGGARREPMALEPPSHKEQNGHETDEAEKSP